VIATADAHPPEGAGGPDHEGHDPGDAVATFLEKVGQPRRHLSPLLGAGASMSAGLPDLATLAEQVDPLLPTEHAATFRRLLEGRTLEGLLSHVRLVRTLLGSSANTYDGLSGELARQVDREVTRSIATLIGREEGVPLEAHERLASWLGRSLRPSPVEVFTTNYDLLMERALERRGVPYFDGFAGVFRGEFRPDLVEDEEAPPSSRLPAGWVRLWKLHGSVSWAVEQSDRMRVVRRGTYPVTSPDEMLAIYPSSQKYEESRRLPFLALSDRFRRALAIAESTTVTVGFSYGDEHLNELIFNAVERYARSEVIALFRGAIPPVVRERALRYPNLTAYGAVEAVIAGRAGAFEAAAECPGWSGERLLVGDFGPLTSLLARSELRPAAGVDGG
jgi:hypothetical protein